MKVKIKQQFLSSLLLLALSSYLFAQEVLPVDRMIAIVGDDVIVMSELNAELRRAVIKLKKEKVQMPDKRVLIQQVIERLVNQKLQQAEAERLGIVVGEEQLAQAISDIAKRNNMTLSKLRQYLKTEGTSFQHFRGKIRHQFLFKKLIDKQVSRRTSVSDREIESFIQREVGNLDRRLSYHLQHIFLALPDGSTTNKVKAAIKKAKKISQQLKDGADFRKLAATYSNAQNALEGGDMGWLKTSQLPNLYIELASKMNRGDISQPTRSPAGIHIIKVVDFKASGGSALVNQTQARHILIRTNEITSDNDAKVRLTQLQQRIQNGDDFANLARSHSDDKGSAIKGGDMGWLSPGDVVPDFENEMNKLKPKQISPAFRTQFGWHIVQVLARRQHDSSNELRKSKVRVLLKKKKVQEETELYLRRLRDEGYVKLLLDDA